MKDEREAIMLISLIEILLEYNILSWTEKRDLITRVEAIK